MLKNQLILRDPLGFLGYNSEETEKKGSFGAVTSRAGVGKTAFLVQIALSSLLKDKNVLHVSVQDPVDKVNLWYSELFLNLTAASDKKASGQLWDSLLTRRFIMTFETESFDFDRLISRIRELKEQNIFMPQMIILDGLDIDAPVGTGLHALKTFAVENQLTLWFSIRTHRHQTENPARLLRELYADGENDLFDMVIQLMPAKDGIHVNRISEDQPAGASQPPLLFDPATMMIKENTGN